MSVVEYDRPLAAGTRKRHYHVTRRGRVVDFMVQLEVEVQGEWKPILRYDCAHGFVHVDRYNLSGNRKKESLDLSFADALTLAETDINEDWEGYRQRFLEGGNPLTSMSGSTVCWVRSLINMCESIRSLPGGYPEVR